MSSGRTYDIIEKIHMQWIFKCFQSETQRYIYVCIHMPIIPKLLPSKCKKKEGTHTYNFTDSDLRQLLKQKAWGQHTHLVLH